MYAFQQNSINWQCLAYKMRFLPIVIVLFVAAIVQTASLRDEEVKVVEKRSPLLLGKVAVLKALKLLKKFPLPPFFLPVRFEVEQIQEPIVQNGYNSIQQVHQPIVRSGYDH